MTTSDLQKTMGKKGAIEVTCFTGKTVNFQDHEELEKTPPTNHSTVTHLALQYLYKFVHLGKLAACLCSVPRQAWQIPVLG